MQILPLTLCYTYANPGDLYQPCCSPFPTAVFGHAGSRTLIYSIATAAPMPQSSFAPTWILVPPSTFSRPTYTSMHHLWNTPCPSLPPSLIKVYAIQASAQRQENRPFSKRRVWRGAPPKGRTPGPPQGLPQHNTQTRSLRPLHTIHMLIYVSYIFIFEISMSCTHRAPRGR